MPLKAFVKEQVYFLKKSLEESADPINNNKSLISELNDQLKYLKKENKNKTEIIKVLTENIGKHLLSHEEFATTSNSKKRNSSETRNDSLRSPNRFQILASANTDNCDKLIANENVNIQSSNNTFQGHPPQILENTPSSTTANEPPSDINQTNTATHNNNHENGNDTTRKTSNIRTDRNNLRENNSLNKESTNDDQKFKPKRTIAIVGDLMVKNIYGPSYSDNKSNVFVKSISGAKTKCMKSYIIPTVELEPDAIVIHCGTNDLRRQEQPEEIAYEIANLASSIKSKKNEVVVSGIIPRKDRFRDKAKETNESLLAICASRNIPFINHGNIDTRTHINRRGLHLTTRGSKIVGDNIVKFTKNLLFTK